MDRANDARPQARFIGWLARALNVRVQILPKGRWADAASVRFSTPRSRCPLGEWTANDLGQSES